MDKPAAITVKAKPSGKRRELRESVRKWSKTVMRAGFTIIPATLLTMQDELGLAPVDLNILLQLVCHWWKADKLPFPAKGTLAKRMGMDPTTVRRHIAAMERRELLKRVYRTDDARGQRSSYYDLKPLVELLHPLAVKAWKEKERRREERKRTK